MQTNRNSTRRSLIVSAAALVLSLAMLVGTTFAWFTDTASSAVNVIQSGTLDLQLLNEQGTGELTINDKLQWKKSSSAPAGEQILWEPGATYQTDGFQIKNNGDLALKFKLNIGTSTSDLKIVNAIDFYLTATPQQIRSGQQLLADVANNKAVLHLDDQPLSAGKYYDPDQLNGVDGSTTLYLVGHMKEEAGNQYQDASLDGIKLTVLATQQAEEYDSNNNIYDRDAKYPLVISQEQAQDSLMSNATGGATTGNVNVVTASDVVLDLDAAGGFYNATLGGTDADFVTIDAQGNKITFESNYRNAINCYGKLTISNAEMDSTYKPEGSTWDDYALIFKYQEDGANEIVFNNVTFDRQVAIEKGVKATFNNCTINQTAATGDMYALWIQAGADVTLNNCKINSTNLNAGSKNRAIKIADEYVTNPTLTKLSVSGTTFISQKKAAVLVTSTAGADIFWGEGNDIHGVDADTTNAVWNDADRTAAWDLVTVTGCTKHQEQ